MDLIEHKREKRNPKLAQELNELFDELKNTFEYEELRKKAIIK